MIPLRVIILFIFGLNLMCSNTTRGATQGELNEGWKSNRGSAPTVTIVSTYTEVETTSILLTTFRDFDSSRPTSTEGPTESPEETLEPSGKDSQSETTNPWKKERDASWTTEASVGDPPVRPLSIHSSPSVTSTLQQQVTTNPTGNSLGSIAGLTYSSSPTHHPATAQTSRQPISQTSGSIQSTGSPYSTSKPGPQPGHRNLGSSTPRGIYWPVFILITSLFL